MLPSFLPSVLLFTLIVLINAENFNPERTRLVDHDPATGNLIYRGNLPKRANGSFAITEMISAMKSQAASNSVPFPNEFTILDVSFLNVAEEKDLLVEKDFWKQHPKLGSLKVWPIVGSAVNPKDIPIDILKELLKLYPDDSPDQLPKRTAELYSLLKTRHEKPLIIYFHCEAGSDRTGEFFASYVMRYENWTLNQAFAFDQKVSGRPISELSQHGAELFCFWLKYEENINSGSC